jgi:hypothetical protein
MRTGYCTIVPQTHEEKMEMYMRLSKEELAEMLIEANNVIDILRKEPTIVETRKKWEPCKTWQDCTNPHQDCINCPLRYKHYSSFANSNLK